VYSLPSKEELNRKHKLMGSYYRVSNISRSVHFRMSLSGRKKVLAYTIES